MGLRMYETLYRINDNVYINSAYMFVRIGNVIFQYDNETCTYSIYVLKSKSVSEAIMIIEKCCIELDKLTMDEKSDGYEENYAQLMSNVFGLDKLEYERLDYSANESSVTSSLQSNGSYNVCIKFNSMDEKNQRDLILLDEGNCQYIESFVKYTNELTANNYANVFENPTCGITDIIKINCGFYEQPKCLLVLEYEKSGIDRLYNYGYYHEFDIVYNLGINQPKAKIRPIITSNCRIYTFKHQTNCILNKLPFRILSEPFEIIAKWQM